MIEPGTAEPLPYQEELIDHLVEGFAKHQCMADASGTGVGKTFVALFTAKRLGLRPLVICPKSVLPAWKEAYEAVGGEAPVIFSNYESLKTGRRAYFKWISGKRTGEWRIPDNTLLIFDEAHRCRNRTSQNAKMLVAAVNSGRSVLMLSATLAENPMHMFATGMALGLYQKGHYWPWAQMNGVTRGRFGWEYIGGSAGMQKIHAEIFPEKGVRKKPADLPGFPDNYVTTVQLPMLCPMDIDDIWEELQQKKLLDEPLPLVEQLRIRQEVELFKIPSLVEMTKDAVAEGNNVVLFLNFRDSIDVALKGLISLEARALTGDTNDYERLKLIGDFQSNKLNVLVCQARAGGEGISLHDVNGRPRVSLINPSYSATELIQCLGRIHRAGSQSPAVQKLCFAEGSEVESRIRRQVQNKLSNLEALNDGDLI